MTKGIIIAIQEKYEHLLLSNIINLREKFHCYLPIELWQIRQEISDNMMAILNKYKDRYNIHFNNVCEYTSNPEHWKGWQIKAFIMKYTNFKEVILCDCDSLFLINPEIIFNDDRYIKTGTFFFKDCLYHYPKNREVEMAERKRFIRKLMPERLPYFPEEWNYIYDLPDTVQSMWFYQESGVVFMNKTMNTDVVNTIYELNDNHEETYKYVYGDKETFWIACVMNNKPFAMNEKPGENYIKDDNLPQFLHTGENYPAFAHTYNYGGNESLFFSQKAYPFIKKTSPNMPLQLQL